MRIVDVEFRPEREETKTVLIDKEALTSQVFFEVNQVLALHGETDENADPCTDKSLPLLHTATYGSWTALSCDYDACFFSYSPLDTANFWNKHMRLTLKDTDGKISSMCWLPGIEAILLTTTHNKMMIVNVAAKTPLFMAITSIPTERAFVSVRECGEWMEMWLVNEHGEWVKWTVRVETVKRAVRDGLMLTDQDITEASGSFCDSSNKVFFQDVIRGQFNFFGLSIEGQLWVVDPLSGMHYSLAFPSALCRLRECCDGRYLLCLSVSGSLLLIDQLTMQPLFIRQIVKSESEKVLNFELTENTSALGDFSLLLLLQNVDGHRVEVRNFASRQSAYSARTNASTQIFIASDHNASLLFIFELENGSSLYLRELTEMQPEKRLDRLISKRRFDEAEAFAKQFGLDLQRIHTCRIECLVEDIEMAVSEQEKALLMQRLLSSLQQLNDDNLVGDQCYSVARLIANGDFISQLLAVTKKRNISDSETVDKLNSLGYVFCTYRMVFGPSASFDDTWTLFLEAIDDKDYWAEIFNTLVSKGLIAESRIMWHRHERAILSFFIGHEKSAERVKDFFFELQQVLSRNLSHWHIVVEFLVEDVMVALVQHESIEAFEEFSLLLLQLISDLELREPNGFPDNSLYVAHSFDRFLRNITHSTISPTRQASLGFYAATLKCSAASSAIEDMATRVVNLTAIKSLKQVYNYETSYSQYEKMTPERICHNILSRQLEKLDLFRANFEQFVKPFMAEHRLDVNSTLFSYIQRVSKMDARTYKPAWEEVCLLLADSIDDATTRCEAVTSIASGASIPWRQQLVKAVDYLRKDESIDANAREKLEREIQWAELMQLFHKYSVTDVNLRAALQYPDVIFTLIQYMFKQKEVSTTEMERLKDGLKVAEVYNKVTGKLLLDQVAIDRVYINFISAIGQDVEVTALSSVLDTLQSALAAEQLSSRPSSLSFVIGTYVDSLIHRAEQTVCHNYADDVARRMQNLVKACSILMRYLMQEKEYARKYDCVRRMIRLQEGYQLVASISQLNDLQWRALKLVAFIEKPSEENETLVVNMDNIYHFASLLGLTELETGSILTEAFEQDYGVLLRILGRISQSLSCADEPMLERCLSVCESVLQLMHSLSLLKAELSSDSSSRNQLQQLFDDLPDLSRALRNIALHSQSYQRSAMRMYKYTRLLQQVVNQCLLGESETTSSSSIESAVSETKKAATRESMILGMSRRVGCYQLRQDGSIFERVPVLTAFGVCAASVVRQPDKSHEEQRGYWEEAFTTLGAHQQDVIEINARIFASSLACFAVESCESPLVLSHAVKNICQRALQMHPCDLWTIATLILALPPNSVDMFIQSLRRWVSAKRAPQTHINFLRVAQFVICVNSRVENSKYVGALVDSYWARSWAKRFGKMGVAVNVQAMAAKPASILEDLSRHLIDSHVVAEFVTKCSESSADFNHCLLAYANYLIMKASNATDGKERHLSLLSADAALRMLKARTLILQKEEEEKDSRSSQIIHLQKHDGKENREFHALRTILYVVSPYNYEVIVFLVKWLSLFSSSEEENAFVYKIEALINHLHKIKRVGQMSRAENNWYVERQKALQAEKNTKRPEGELYGSELRAMYERDDATESFLGSVSMLGAATSTLAPLYEREDSPLCSLPFEASARLPFHPFLFSSLSKIDKFLVPIVEAEVTIDSLLVWQAALRKLPNSRKSDRLSRNNLLTIAISKKGHHAANTGKPLSTEDAKTIHSLLETTTERKAVVFCIGICFTKLPLCEAKIQLLELGCRVATDWLERKNQLESPLSSSEEENISEQCRRLREAISNYNTEFILRKFGLFDSSTSERLDKPAELIGHILSERIDWQNATDRAEKVKMAAQLAEVNGVDIDGIYESLIDSWLRDSDITGVIDVDMNDTIGAASHSALPAGEDADESDLFALPVFDVSIARIVFLLRLTLLSRPQLLRHLVSPLLAQKSKGPVDAARCKSYIRTACVLLMAFTQEELAAAGMTVEEICVHILEKQSYIRVLELSGLEMSFEQMRKLDKAAVVKNAIQSLRSNSTVLTVAVCVLIDHDVADAQLIESLLQKMIKFGKWRLIHALLLFCKQEHPTLCQRIKSLVLSWVRVFQNAIEVIDSEESNQNVSFVVQSSEFSSSLLKWLYFLISCPVEGGQSMRALSAQLRTRNCLLAACLAHISADFSQKLSISLPVSSSPFDLHLYWSSPNSTSPSSVSRSSHIQDISMDDYEEHI